MVNSITKTSAAPGHDAPPFHPPARFRLSRNEPIRANEWIKWLLFEKRPPVQFLLISIFLFLPLLNNFRVEETKMMCDEPNFEQKKGENFLEKR